MTLPEFPRWATGATADVVEPPNAKKEEGWLGGATPDVPPAQYFNWLHRQTYEALVYLRGVLLYQAANEWFARDSLIDAANDVAMEDVIVSNDASRLIAVGNRISVGRLISSLDGEIWAVGQVCATAMFSVAWGDSKAVAVGGDGGASVAIWTSADGAAWVDRSASRPATASGRFLSITWDEVNSLWIAITATQVYTTTDPDAVAWTLRLTAAVTFVAVKSNPLTGRSWAVGSNGNSYYSTNGTAWTEAFGAGALPLRPRVGERIKVGVATINGEHHWIIPAYDVVPAINEAALLHSVDDGVTWSNLSLDTGYPLPTHANAHMIFAAYSQPLGHWLFGGNGAVGDFRVYAGDPGAAESFTMVNHPPAAMTDYQGMARAGVYVDLAVLRREQYWVTVMDADSDEAIAQSSNPII